MSQKVRVALLCGGRSPEHRISLISAQNIIKSLDPDKYELVIIGISHQGNWMHYPENLLLDHPNDPNKIKLIPSGIKVSMSVNRSDRAIIDLDNNKLIPIDVIYPILHGNNGEDGTIQGLAKLAGIPCVGCGINGSVLSMDKDLMKKILKDHKIAVAKSVTAKSDQPNQWNYDGLSKSLGSTMYIKPARLGSSIGVSRVNNSEGFDKALKLAFEFDDKVLIEENIVGREIECAVLGNDDPSASTIGEITAENNFYSFDNKYVKSDGADLAIPAKLDQAIIQAAQELAVKAYRAMDCLGLSRVDMFYKENGELLINEINTIPGFTNISMYPKLWEHSGLDQTALISRLIEFALAQHEKESKFKHIA